LERSLSVLLPVQNVQSTLTAMVLELLEILPELTTRFELIIIDDGSADATSEVADDLAARYPQVQRLFHVRPLGRSEAVRTGLRRATGDVIFLRDEDCRLAIDELHKLWRAVDDHPLVLGRSGMVRWPNKLIGWKRHAEQGHFRMVNRHALRGLQESLDDQARLVASLARQGQQWHEVEVSQRCAVHDSRTSAAPVSGHVSQSADATSPRTSAKSSRGGYLRGLKNFALGE
jgi:glycosyltransferase involved in cell wall biosynthesis